MLKVGESGISQAVKERRRARAAPRDRMRGRRNFIGRAPLLYLWEIGFLLIFAL
jgi:hypothetical protein